MEMAEDYREVRYDQYCQTCKFKATKETDDPCNECLDEFYNQNTEKPVNWKEGDSK